MKTTRTLKNPNAEASISQQIQLRRFTGCDWRSEKCTLTMQEASGLISACYEALRGVQGSPIEATALAPTNYQHLLKDPQIAQWASRGGVIAKTKAEQEAFEHALKNPPTQPPPVVVVTPAPQTGKITLKPVVVRATPTTPTPTVGIMASGEVVSAPLPKKESPLEEALSLLDKRALLGLVSKKLASMERDQLKELASLILA